MNIFEKLDRQNIPYAVGKYYVIPRMLNWDICIYHYIIIIKNKYYVKMEGFKKDYANNKCYYYELSDDEIRIFKAEFSKYRLVQNEDGKIWEKINL